KTALSRLVRLMPGFCRVVVFASPSRTHFMPFATTRSAPQIPQPVRFWSHPHPAPVFTTLYGEMLLHIVLLQSRRTAILIPQAGDPPLRRTCVVQFFLDTASLNEIEVISRQGITEGVTTNQKILLTE